MANVKPVITKKR